jgi:excisionase family DNA binding protein
MENEDERDKEQNLLTVNEACQTLRISRWTLYGLIREGKIRTVRIKKRRLIPVSAISEFIHRELE